jgi:hypothetical protein
MSKTLSLIIRVVAVLGALGAGAAYYLIHEEQLEFAMQKTEWIDSDKLLNDKANADADNKDFVALPTSEVVTAESSVFVKRMARLDPGVRTVLENKRKEIVEKRQTIEARDATIKERDATIEQKDAEITRLETEKAELNRLKDELTSKLAAATANIATLESEKSVLQAQNQSLTEEMKDTNKYIPRAEYDKEVTDRKAAEDKVGNASRVYTNFWNWIVQNTGVKPPYPRILDLSAPNPVQVTPQPKDAVPRISTKIVTADLRKGVLAISIGRTTTGIRPGAFYEVEKDGSNIGKIRLEEVDSSISTAAILPGAFVGQFVQNAIIHLVPVQSTGARVDVNAHAPAPTATIAPAPAAPAPAPAEAAGDDLGIPAS